MINTKDNRPVVELKDVHKIYHMGNEIVKAVDGISLKIHHGELVSIMGPSGSGKSTMMHIIGALDLPTKGKVLIDETDLSKLSEDDIATIRGKKIGFIFQEFNLIPTLSALENVRLPMLFQDYDEEDLDQNCIKLLTKVGLKERIHHKPTELSGGQQQRVAIARSLVNDPDIILADEPTGALDSKSNDEIIFLLEELNRQGKTVIIITHNKSVADHTDRNIILKDGKIMSDTYRKKQ